MTEGTGNVVEGEWRTLSPSFSSTNTAPRNHKQTARATPTVPSGSYEKFNSNTRPVNKLSFLLYRAEITSGERTFPISNVIQIRGFRQAQYVGRRLCPSDKILIQKRAGASPRDLSMGSYRSRHSTARDNYIHRSRVAPELIQQMLLNKEDRRIIEIVAIVLLAKPVSFVVSHQEPHRRVVLSGGRNDLLSLGVRHAGIILPLNHKQRLRDLVSVR